VNPTEGHEHRREMAALWHHEMEQLAQLVGFNVGPILMIDLQDATPGPTFKAGGTIAGKSVDVAAIMDSWGEKDVIVAITGQTITPELVRRLATQRFRFASAPTVRMDFEGFKADYSKIPLRFEILAHRMARAFAAEMTFRYQGKSWKCSLDLRGQRYQFHENGQAHRPGEFINYPSGCANIPPYASIAGDPRGASRSEGEIPALIGGELVVFVIRENRIVEIKGDGAAAQKERASVLDPAHPEMAVVTKLGLGVNDQARCNGVHVGDEKTMGMHWGYGPKKRFPDTIWAEHPISMDIDFVYPDGSREPIFRNTRYTRNLGELFA
jgi:hypothetical protein